MSKPYGGDGKLKGARVTQLMPQLSNKNLNQAAAVQNTWYYLGALRNITWLLLDFAVTGANETLECAAVIDGKTYTATQAAVAGTTYRFGINNDHTNSFAEVAGILGHGYSHFHGRSVVIGIRKTTNAGVAALRMNMIYEQW